jgi:hypothetical protein
MTNPQVITGLINAWGGAQFDYPERRHCCGFGFRQYLIKENRGYSVSNSRIKFESVEPLLIKLGMNYDPAGKFRGINGVTLGQPGKPTTLKTG